MGTTQDSMQSRVPIALCLIVHWAWSMDVSWTPSDPDGPLPNSKAYLDKLARLCELLKQDKLPPKLPRRTIQSQCAKLADKMRGSICISDTFSVSVLVRLGVVIVGAYMLSQQGEAVPEQVNVDDIYLPGGTLSQQEAG